MSTIKLSKSILILALLFILPASVFSQEKTISYSEVPASIRTYIKTHFPNHKVIQSEIDFEGVTKKYEIMLSDGVKLEFNKKGKIKEIDSNSKLPDSVIPKKIREYVQTNFPDYFITDWSLEKKHQKVELNNGLELEFTLKGDFLRIDD